MSLKNLVERELISCQPDTTIRRVAQMMEKENVGAVLITENGKPRGIVTDRDLIIRCLSQAMNCENKPVREVMTTPVDTVNFNSGVYDVIQVMKKNEIRRVPIVDDQGNAVGLLSFGDLFQLLGKEINDLTVAAGPEKPKIVQQAA